MRQKCVRAVPRALRAKMYSVKIMNFPTFSQYLCTDARFPRAQPRARPFSARHCILLITEMLFDYLIAIVALKAAEIGMSQGTTKIDTFAPPIR